MPVLAKAISSPPHPVVPPTTATSSTSVLQAMRPQAEDFHNPDELVFLWASTPTGSNINISLDDWLNWRDQSESFAEMSVFNLASSTLTIEQQPQRARILRSSSNLLSMWGLTPQIGRLPAQEEESAASDRVVLLAYKLWRRRFGGDPKILGQTVKLNNELHTIIGILPSELSKGRFWGDVNLFAPLIIDQTNLNSGVSWDQAMARLNPAVTIDQGQAEMNAFAAQFAQANPETKGDVRIVVQKMMDYFLPLQDRLFEKALLAAVGLVLLIACINLANLLLAKATARTREFAVRAALGAGRGRIIRQLFIESLMLALTGGVLGLLVGLWAIDLLVANIDNAPFVITDLGLNSGVLIYTLVISLGASVFFGLLPALTATKVSLHEELKEGSMSASAGRSRNRLRNALVMGQLAVALPLLVCCGMVTRNLIALKSTDFGYITDRLITLQIDLPDYRYEKKDQQIAYFNQALGTIRALPGIENAGAAMKLPVYGDGSFYAPFAIEGRNNNDSQDYIGYIPVTSGFFDTLGVPLLRGRFFTDLDHDQAQPVAIINARLAQQYWPNEEPLGKRLTMDPDAVEPIWITVVGIISDAGRSFNGGPPDPTLYLPYTQHASGALTVVARTLAEPMSFIDPIRTALHTLDPEVPIYQFQTVDAMANNWLDDDRVAAYFFGGLALLALGLASIGLYGMMSYGVVQRTTEIGIRVAFGAVSKNILQLVLKRCFRLALMGIIIGLVLSIPAGIIMASQLYNVSWIDPLSYGSVVLLFLAVTLLAGYIPARRATRINPLTALRNE